jgi:hypothetical protein
LDHDLFFRSLGAQTGNEKILSLSLSFFASTISILLEVGWFHQTEKASGSVKRKCRKEKNDMV